MEEIPVDNSATAGAAVYEYTEEIDSCCSTPYVSAPSSPCREGAPFAGFYYSAPSSPTHFVLTATNLGSGTTAVSCDVNSSFEFDFSATYPNSGASSPGTMSSADELFFNGQIRPMKLSTHLQRPQTLAPLIESSSDGIVEEDQSFSRGRELKLRAGSLRRRTRSMSPLRNTEIWQTDVVSEKRYEISSHQIDANEPNGKNPSASRSSSSGRSSGRWEFLKDFLYRSKSEGRNRNRNEGHKFWGSLSFSPVKDKKPPAAKDLNNEGKKTAVNRTGGKRRFPPPSPHEVHYTAKRAQAEEMRKRTFLPYRQGLLSCLGFNSRSYTAMAGFGRVLRAKS